MFRSRLGVHCYGIGSFDIGNGPENLECFWGHGIDRKNLGPARTHNVPHKMEEKKWHHVAGSYDGETMKIYLDGDSHRRGKEGSSISLVTMIADLLDRMRKKCPTVLTFMSTASIDEAAVWQRALSDTEIKQAMSGNFLAVSPTDKVATTWANMKKREYPFKS